MSTLENDKETDRYVYNGLSWKLREIDPDIEKVQKNYEYDQSGNLASFTDRKGITRKYIYIRPTSMTTFGRTYEQRYEDEDDTPDSIVYPDGTITAYNYDELGRILSVKHPGMGKITYDYDTSIAGNTVHVQYPNGTKIEKGFNSFGQTTDV